MKLINNRGRGRVRGSSITILGGPGGEGPYNSMVAIVGPYYSIG